MTGHAIITGGASGIGLETAKILFEQGMKVSLWDASEQNLNAARQQLQAHDNDTTYVRVDVSDQNAVQNAMNQVDSIDIFVAAAGVCRQARLDDDNSDVIWHDVLNINLNGVYYCMKAAAPKMADNSAMVAVSSGLGKNGRPGYEAYTVSKHGVLGLVKCMALELAPRVRVNAVCPGWVNTSMAAADLVESARRAQQEPQEMKQKALQAMALQRMVEPREVGELICWLASNKASAITGQSYNISCGEYFH